jgi:rubrerythrin
LVRDSIPLLADLPTAEERACPVCGDDFKGFPDDKRCPTCQKAIDDASDDAQVTP